MDSVPNRNSPTVRKGCAKGTGYSNHLLHNEHPCDSCKEGKKEKDKQWVTSEPGKIKRKSYIQQYRENNQEHIKAQVSNYYLKNKESIKLAHANYYQNNKEHVLNRLKENKIKNPEVQRKGWRTRRARVLNAESEPYTTEEILELYGTACYLCGEEIDLTAPRSTAVDGWEKGLQLDHLVPLSKGGTDLKENLRPSHGLCNIRKGTTSIEGQNSE